LPTPGDSANLPTPGRDGTTGKVLDDSEANEQESAEQQRLRIALESMAWIRIREAHCGLAQHTTFSFGAANLPSIE